MNKERLLILFVKNSEKGKVKTRLAKTVGDQRALNVYEQLVKITKAAATEVASERQVWYSNFVEDNDFFKSDDFGKRVQAGRNLGERLKFAASEAFETGYCKVVIIGSDCPDLNGDILEEAFQKLDEHDVVLGPSVDGGYYLIGLTGSYPELFDDIAWSTSGVLNQTKEKLVKYRLSWSELEQLNDIDNEEDLKNSSMSLE